MNKHEFISDVRQAVYEPAVRGVLSSLEKPPGRSPSPKLVALAKWFGGLSQENQSCVRAIVSISARDAVFGMLCVLDGVRSISTSGEEDMSLELRAISQMDSHLLNGPDGPYLHDLFADEVPPL